MRLPAFLKSSAPKGEYELLPSTNAMRLTRVSSMRRKAALLALISIPLLSLGVYYHYPDHVVAAAQKVKEMVTGKLPPDYSRFYELERNYPQHDASLPYPEGQNGRFLWVNNQHWGEHAL